MSSFILKAIGYIEIFIVLICFGGVFFYSNIDGTIIWPELFKLMIYFLLVLLSGFGILFKKKTLFVCIFYLIGFLCLDIAKDFIELHFSYKANFTTKEISILYQYYIQKSIFYIFCLIGLTLLMSSKITLIYFKVDRKINFLKHILFSVMIYAFIWGVNVSLITI